MNNQTIKKTGRMVFLLLWGIGSICLFGYLFSDAIEFAVAGFYLLIAGTIFSLIFIISFIAYGLAEPEKFNACLYAVRYLLYNIPISIVYAVIGINIVSL